MKRTELIAHFVSFVLVVITFLGILWQREDNSELRKLGKEQLEQQKKDSQAQRDDAKILLEAQISVEFDKQFDSLEMRQARRRIATQLMNNKIATEARVPLFLDKLGLYAHQGRIDRATVYHSYVYWVERYWPAIKPSVEEFRKKQNDKSFWVEFEKLYGDMLADDAKYGLPQPSEMEIQRFLKEEATLPQ